MNVKFETKDVIVMKLLHYFITECNYSPVILHGVSNEIWLENMNSDYKIVRIVSNYIHNDEQFNFDLYKTKRIVHDIKKKTFNLNMDVLSIFTDLGANVNLKSEDHLDCVYLKNEKDVKKYNYLYDYFPDIDKKLTFTEKGVNLFLKITSDINEKNQEESKKIENVFAPKKPIVTYILIAINVLIFLFCLLSDYDLIVDSFCNYGPFVRIGEYYRLLTSAFLHSDIIHLGFNMYALYQMGSQVESFFGKFKFLFIYLFSAITGSLLSILLNVNSASIGASGAIFGLFGAMLYFGYYYRVYLGNTIIKQILPIIIINLGFGFMYPLIDNYAHIGGLVGGILSSMIMGLSSKIERNDRINGIILTIILLAFLIFMNFIYIK